MLGCGRHWRDHSPSATRSPSCRAASRTSCEKDGLTTSIQSGRIMDNACLALLEILKELDTAAYHWSVHDTERAKRWRDARGVIRRRPVAAGCQVPHQSTPRRLLATSRPLTALAVRVRLSRYHVHTDAIGRRRHWRNRRSAATSATSPCGDHAGGGGPHRRRCCAQRQPPSPVALQ